MQNINCKIFVTFAKQDVQKHNNLNGPGLGFVDVFDTDGNLLMSLEYGDWMDAPWGIALAPSDFGSFSDDLLVGNFGSGQIAAFDPGKGKFHAILKNTSGEPIIIEGLWGLGFGNGATAGPKNNLFFTAGINDEAHGLFGTITTILPVPVSNLIKNLGFESGRKDWVFYTNGTVRFNIISPGFEGNNASEVKIMRRSSNFFLTILSHLFCRKFYRFDQAVFWHYRSNWNSQYLFNRCAHNRSAYKRLCSVPFSFYCGDNCDKPNFSVFISLQVSRYP
ncbi:MAG: TIGR03118 family protein [Candidatus Methanoperedens sp.]|nr:MAG: TIGR03118 family protein [Candidatus Methanoperedens sp.]MBZ0174285.1 TIGR03118 family protein [Candidatus Methanoperedens nitroreducens]